jgi:hypothetical protein
VYLQNNDEWSYLRDLFVCFEVNNNEKVKSQTMDRKKAQKRPRAESSLLFETYPALRNELNFEESAKLNPGYDLNQLATQSHRTVVWSCKKSQCAHPHTWVGSVFHRTASRKSKKAVIPTICPFCTSQQICPCNAVWTKYPLLKDELDVEETLKLNPDCNLDLLTCQSSRQIGWHCKKSKCEHPHKWVARVNDRTKTGEPTECPFCTERKICPCVSLWAKYPELKDELDIEETTKLNPEFDLELFTVQSNRQIAWHCKKSKCKHQHKWSGRVYDRTKPRKNKNAVIPSPCPYCSEQRMCLCNNIWAKFPHMRAQVDEDYVKENYPDLEISEVSVSSNRLFRWICDKGTKEAPHVWEATVLDRTVRKNTRHPIECPWCNSVWHNYPELKEELQVEKSQAINPDIDIFQCSRFSHYKMVWKCQKCKHDFTTRIDSRTSKAIGCPKCASSRSKGEEDMTRALDSLKAMGLPGVTSIFVDHQKRLPCTDIDEPLLTRQLRADFFITLETEDKKQIQALLEFDGLFHFEQRYANKTIASQKNSQLYEVIRRDRSKNMFCHKNNIHLLRVCYLDRPQIPQLLNDFFKKVLLTPEKHVIMVSNGDMYNKQMLVNKPL